MHTVPYGNHGCKGGNMPAVYRYVIANEGVDTQNSYPFRGKVNATRTVTVLFQHCIAS